jgi:hypothetical protein
VVGRVALVVIAAGGCACALLAMRQSRLQVASELVQAQLRITEADERLFLLRARVAQRVTPQNVDRLARELGPMRPLHEPPPSAPPAASAPIASASRRPTGGR